MKHKVTTHTLRFDLTELNHVRRKLLENICSDVQISFKKSRMKLGIPEGLEDYNLLLNHLLPPTFVLKLQAALNRTHVGTNEFG